MRNKLIQILRDHFGIDENNVIAHYEIIYRDKDVEKFQFLRDLYLKHLASHPRKDEVAKKLYVGEDVIVHLHLTFPRKEVANIKPASILYYPICTIEEIGRIENPKTAADYLLRLRADAIADNSRIARIFFSRMSKFTGDWSLSEYYDDSEFAEYVEKLPPSVAEKCLSVPAGFIFVREPNGACIKSELGNVIIVSEALRHFLYYMNVFAHHRNFGLDFDDAIVALFIAIRTMLQTEAPDFDIDPRGNLPGPIDNYCRVVTEDQLQFVIGHEYAHLILGHLGNETVMAPSSDILAVLPSHEIPQYYTPRQQQEFDADLGSVMNAEYSENERVRIMNGATLFLLYLDLYYSVSDYINPSVGSVKTHPDPIERIWALRRSVFARVKIESNEIFSDDDISDWISFFGQVKNSLQKNILPFHIEDLERYSSTYFRNRGIIEKIDRFDF